jgi:hypothetical protein
MAGTSFLWNGSGVLPLDGVHVGGVGVVNVGYRLVESVLVNREFQGIKILFGFFGFDQTHVFKVLQI